MTSLREIVLQVSAQTINDLKNSRFLHPDDAVRLEVISDHITTTDKTTVDILRDNTDMLAIIEFMIVKYAEFQFKAKSHMDELIRRSWHPDDSIFRLSDQKISLLAATIDGYIDARDSYSEYSIVGNLLDGLKWALKSRENLGIQMSREILSDREYRHEG